MTKENFWKLLRHASTVARDFAKNYVLDELPLECKYSVTLNASSDDPSLIQFDIYPNDNSKIFELVEEKEVIKLICRKDKVPVWIDISVESVYTGKRFSDFFVQDVTLTMKRNSTTTTMGQDLLGLKALIYQLTI